MRFLHETMLVVLAVLVAIVTWILVAVIGGEFGARLGYDQLGSVFFLIFGPILAYLAFNSALEYFSNQHKKKERRKRESMEQEERRKLEAAAYQAAQRTLESQLSDLVSVSMQLIDNLPELVRDAEHALDVAEREFKEGAFSLFWDAIWQAVNKLATFQSHIQLLIRNIASHKERASMLDRPLPPLQLEIHKLPDVSPTVIRMNAIVRPAQKDPNFAVIYEQHKTNQLLVAGFSSLGQAVSNLGASLHSSLSELESSVTTAISDSSLCASKMASDLLAEVQLFRVETARDSGARHEHEQKELEMLDNIQRREKPRW